MVHIHMKGGKEIALPVSERKAPPTTEAVLTTEPVDQQAAETFYLLLYKPQGNLETGVVYHPLYELYESILNEELPMY